MHIGRNCQRLALVAFVLFIYVFVFETALFASSIVEFTAIGKIESIYKDRASMSVLHIVSSNADKANIATGSWVSFDIPKGNLDRGSRREKAIAYGDVVEVSLLGNVATEYEVNEDYRGDKKFSSSSTASNVLLWTCQSCAKVKNPKEYLPESEEEKSGGRKKGKKKESKEPVKIWTQEETVRGKVLVKGDMVYLKEERLGRRDKGLELTKEEWVSKLKEFHEQKVVVHGITHRTSSASGTMEIHNILKVYPK